jgi:8-oxo-dGTP pyrophosphatase MutT (NUDIX family)
VHSVVMSAQDPRLSSSWSPLRTTQPSAKFFRLSQLRRMRGCEQVAAVCYRVRGKGIEFLLVQTRGGRWTFPKGSAEPGLTHAQAAALEAFEEAGVHGRMEEASFARYIRRRRGGNSATKSGERSMEKELAVNAHLCEVLRLGAPQESDRNPTWFSAEKTKRRLREARTPEYATELARLVDRAAARIQRLRTSGVFDGRQFDPQLDRPKKDALQKVHFMIDHARGTTSAAKAFAKSRRNRRNIVQIDQF